LEGRYIAAERQLLDVVDQAHIGRIVVVDDRENIEDEHVARFVARGVNGLVAVASFRSSQPLRPHEFIRRRMSAVRS